MSTRRGKCMINNVIIGVSCTDEARYKHTIGRPITMLLIKRGYCGVDEDLGAQSKSVVLELPGEVCIILYSPEYSTR